MNRLNCLSEKSREDTINDWIFWAVNFYHKYVWNAYFSVSGENRTNDSGSVYFTGSFSVSVWIFGKINAGCLFAGRYQSDISGISVCRKKAEKKGYF